MFWVLAGWLYVGLLCTVLGAVATSVALTGATWRPRAYFLPWIGMAVAALVASTWSLFAAVGPDCHLALLAITLLSLCSAPVRAELRAFATAVRDIPLLAWPILAWLALTVAFAGTDAPVYNLDPGRYHFQNLLWTKSFPVVPGLANLHNRYAFSSSWYPFHALFDWGLFEDRSYHVINSFLFFLLVGFGVVCAVRSLRDRPGPIEAAGLAMLVFLGYYYDLFRYLFLSCLTPDLPVNLFVVICLLVAFDVLQTDARPAPGAFLLLVLLASQTFAIRPSGAYVGALLLVVAAHLARTRGGLRAVVRGAGLGVLLSTPALIRSYVLSGWPLFPSTSLGFLTPDWQYPREDTVWLMDNAIRRFAYLAHLVEEGQDLTAPHPEIALPLAFMMWLRHEVTAGGFLYWVLGGLVLARVAQSTSRRSSVGHLLPLLAASLVAALAWIVTSPHFRYGFGYVAIAFAGPAALLVASAPVGPRWDAFRRVVVGVTLVVILANMTLKTAGVSARETGLLYPWRVIETFARASLGPLLGLPQAPYVTRLLQGRPFHQVLWDGTYVEWGRFRREPLMPMDSRTTDDDGVIRSGYPASHNASIATMIWAAPLPAWAGIVPGLEFRGSGLEHGFRVRPRAQEKSGEP